MKRTKGEIPPTCHTMTNEALKVLVTRLFSAGERDLALLIEKHLQARPKAKERTYKVQSDGSSFNKFLPQQHSWIPGKDCWRNGDDPRSKERARL